MDIDEEKAERMRVEIGTAVGALDRFRNEMVGCSLGYENIFDKAGDTINSLCKLEKMLNKALERDRIFAEKKAAGKISGVQFDSMHVIQKKIDKKIERWAAEDKAEKKKD